MKRFIIKLIIYFAIVIISQEILHLYQAPMYANMAIQQLKDSNVAYMTNKAYLEYLNTGVFIAYVLIAVAMFSSNVKKLFKKNGGK